MKQSHNIIMVINYIFLSSSIHENFVFPYICFVKLSRVLIYHVTKDFKLFVTSFGQLPEITFTVLPSLSRAIQVPLEKLGEKGQTGKQ